MQPNREPVWEVSRRGGEGDVGNWGFPDHTMAIVQHVISRANFGLRTQQFRSDRISILVIIAT